MANLNCCSIGVVLTLYYLLFIDFWEIARDKPLWRATIREGSATFEAKRYQELEEKKNKGKSADKYDPLSHSVPIVRSAAVSSEQNRANKPYENTLPLLNT